MKKMDIKFNLSISVFKEGKHFIAYSPALDLSTSGKDYEDVKKRFSEVVNIFFQETSKRGTLETVLRELGWQKRDQKNWIPPVPISHESEEFKIALPV